MNGVKVFDVHEHVPYLLDLAHRRMQQDLASIVKADAFPELRGSHMRLLSMIPSTGARPSWLAAIANVTRPALGELVRHLEVHDYVTTDSDPSDGRAVIVGLTPRGKKAAAAANKGIAELKRVWAREIGADRLDAMMDALAAITIGQRPPA
jgi:DNA-binding MarR family transcriptional regulator